MRLIAAMGVLLVTSTQSLAAEPLIVAHRGASADAPENTLPAFELAWCQGADAIEGDFYLTKDGQIVCIHDGDTGRVAGAKLVVKASTLDELRRLDVGRWRGPEWAGVRIPTLGEVLATVPAGKRIYIEVKDTPGIIPMLLEEIAKSRLTDDQVVVIAFNADVIRDLKAAAPRYRAYWLSGFKNDDSGQAKPALETILATLDRIGADGFSSSSKGIDESIVKAVQQAGYPYHVWTVDDLGLARQFWQWGAVSITTNMPGRLKAGFAELARANAAEKAACRSAETRPARCHSVRLRHRPHRRHLGPAQASSRCWWGRRCDRFR